MFERSKGMAVLLTLLFVAMQVSTTVAFAQSAAPPVVYTSTAYVDHQATVNNCSAGEPVSLNGTVQFTYQFTTD